VATPGETPVAPSADPEIRYLGLARAGAMVRALINDAGRQRFVKVGDTTALGQVLEIHDEYIMVGADIASAKRIELAAKALAARQASQGTAEGARPPKGSGPASAATLAAAREMSEKSARAQAIASNPNLEVRGGNFRPRPAGANPPGSGLTAQTVRDQRLEKQRREEIRAMLKSNNPGGFKNDAELNDLTEKILVEEMEAKRREKEE
jgi:multidrug efflux pump subunit AcrA (membrane-fusion protein)